MDKRCSISRGYQSSENLNFLLVLQHDTGEATAPLAGRLLPHFSMVQASPKDHCRKHPSVTSSFLLIWWLPFSVHSRPLKLSPSHELVPDITKSSCWILWLCTVNPPFQTKWLTHWVIKLPRSPRWSEAEPGSELRAVCTGTPAPILLPMTFSSTSLWSPCGTRYARLVSATCRGFVCKAPHLELVLTCKIWPGTHRCWISVSRNSKHMPLKSAVNC